MAGPYDNNWSIAYNTIFIVWGSSKSNIRIIIFTIFILDISQMICSGVA